MKKFPSDLMEIKYWRSMVFSLFAFYTGSGVNDLHGAVKAAYMSHKTQPELVTRSVRIIRQVIMRHVDPFDPAVGNAIFFLFDWNNYRYKFDTVKAKTNQRYMEL